MEIELMSHHMMNIHREMAKLCLEIDNKNKKKSKYDGNENFDPKEAAELLNNLEMLNEKLKQQLREQKEKHEKE